MNLRLRDIFPREYPALGFDYNEWKKLSTGILSTASCDDRWDITLCRTLTGSVNALQKELCEEAIVAFENVINMKVDRKIIDSIDDESRSTRYHLGAKLTAEWQSFWCDGVPTKSPRKQFSEFCWVPAMKIQGEKNRDQLSGTCQYPWSGAKRIRLAKLRHRSHREARKPGWRKHSTT